MKIWLADKNTFYHSGTEGAYELIGEMDILKQQFTISLNGRKAKFYKIVVEGRHNMVNRWGQLD